MRKTIRKLFFAWDFDKEERWLNEMAAKGLNLVSVGYCRYDFESGVPGEYGIRLQLLEQHAAHPESEHYIEFLEETGAEHVGTYWRWAYFRKKKEAGGFELFSDNASRIKHLTRIMQLISGLGAMNLSIGVYNLILFAAHHIPINLLGLLNIALCVLCLYGYLRLAKKRNALKADQQLFE